MTPPADHRATLAGALRAERIKLRRSFAVTLVLIVPGVASLITAALKHLISVNPHAPEQAASAYVVLCLSIWGMLFGQMHVILRCAAAGQVEFANRGLKHLFALPVSRRTIYTAKALMAAASVTAAMLVYLGLATIIGFAQGLLTFQTPTQLWSDAALQVALALLAMLALCSLHLALSVNLASFAAVTGLGFACTLFSFSGQQAFDHLAVYVPWCMPATISRVPQATQTLAAVWAIGLIAISCLVGVRLFERRTSL